VFNEYRGPIVLVVQITDEDGTDGWGELPLSFHPVIPGDAIGTMVESLASRLVVGEVPQPRRFSTDAERLTGWMWYPHFGAMIISGIEMALWDLLGKQLGVNVTQLLGGRMRESMRCMWFVFDDDIEEMAASTREGAARGFMTFYLKWFGDEEAMLEKLGAVRDSLPGGGLLRIDPNESWTRSSAIRRLERLRSWPLEFVEQPLPRRDVPGIGTTRARTSVAIASDQSTRLASEVMEGLLHNSFDTLTVSPSDAGGISAALDITNIARAAGVAVSMHSNNETGIGLASLITVATTAPNCTYASQTEYPHLEWDIVKGIHVDGDEFSLPWDQPGLGIDIDRDALQVARANFESGSANILPIQDRSSGPYYPGY
jgi:L-alanine-DL-glutamate epimerase-like enolase superfamily enzyme